MAHPPELDRDLEKMIGNGVPVFAVEEDLRERGLTAAELICDFQPVPRSQLPELLERYEQVWLVNP